MRIPSVALLVLAGLLVGCPPPTEGEGEGSGEGEGEGEANPGVALDSEDAADVEANVVVGFGFGARPDGRWAVAYAFLSPSGQVPCETFGTVQPPVDQNDIFVIAEPTVGGDPVTTLVDTVPVQPGNSISMRADPTDGTLVVAYAGGGIARGACAASDVVLAVENGALFDVSTLAADSADAGTTCRDPEDPVCASGDALGRYVNLTIDQDGNAAVAWLDTHFGFSNTDLFSADLEVATGNIGSLALATVDDSSGAGSFSATALLPDGRAVIGHEIIGSNEFPDGNGGTYEVSKGIYAAVEQSDGTWIDTMVQQSATTDSRVSVAVVDGDIYLAYHHAETEQLLVYRSVDEGLSWTPDSIEEGFARSGADPTIGAFSDGTVFVVYGHCKDANDDSGCAAGEDGVRIATKRPGDLFWKKQTFTGDPEDRDGTNVDAVLLPNDTLMVFSVSFGITAPEGQRTLKIQRFVRAE